MAEVSGNRAAADESEEARTLDHLRRHPKLLLQNPELLEILQLSHTSGAAVSLIERQVEVLRGKNRRLEDRLDRLLANGRDNELRAVSVQRLARALIRAPSIAAVAKALRDSMHGDFSVEGVFLGLTTPAFRRHDIDGVVPLETGHAILRAYENFFRTRLIECGPIDAARSGLLFPTATEPMASAAVVPLEKEKTLGMIALGSSDPKRFQPRQGKLFLEMVADLVAAAIKARLQL